MAAAGIDNQQQEQEEQLRGLRWEALKLEPLAIGYTQYFSPLKERVGPEKALQPIADEEPTEDVARDNRLTTLPPLPFQTTTSSLVLGTSQAIPKSTRPLIPRPSVINPRPRSFSDPLSSVSPGVPYVFVRQPKQKLGLALQRSSTDGCFYIRSLRTRLKADSIPPAALLKASVGDKLLSVNGKQVHGVSAKQLAELIRSNSKGEEEKTPLRMQFLSRHLIEHTITSPFSSMEFKEWRGLPLVRVINRPLRCSRRQHRIRVGDVLLEVDGRLAADLGYEQTLRLLRGARDHHMRLIFKRLLPPVTQETQR